MRGQGLGQDHGLDIGSRIVAGNMWLTKAAGQSRLLKLEAVMIGNSWPYQLTLPAVYQLTLHGWRVSTFPEKKHYKDVWFNVISIMRGVGGVKLLQKKCYATSEWKLDSTHPLVTLITLHLTPS